MSSESTYVFDVKVYIPAESEQKAAETLAHRIRALQGRIVPERIRRLPALDYGGAKIW